MTNYVYGKYSFGKLMMSYCITLFMCVALGGIVYAYETTNDTEEAQVKNTDVVPEDEKSLEEDKAQVENTDVVRKSKRKKRSLRIRCFPRHLSAKYVTRFNSANGRFQCMLTQI